ncbi:MAG TPA: PrpF domain-containing protein [Microbacteriaceae bacterium]|nr:PrpF domain-containing protein [Microbacteriaceae bacterium]
MDDFSDGIPAMLMRGGTSKGAYFLAEDLPADPAARDDLLLRIMGTPDPTQIDGIGGAHPLRSKVAVVSRSAEPGVDLDYLFLQVGVETATVSSAQTCGNIIAGVGPFAVERGLVPAGDGETTLRIRLVNTGDLATETFRTPGGRPQYSGDTAIDGVPGTAAPIRIEFDRVRPPLPTGNAVDEVGGHPVTLVDAGMPVVLLDAADFGLTGAETPEELEARADLRAELERVRLAAGALMGLGDVAGQTVPKLALLSAPAAGGAISTRIFIPHRVHQSIGVLMAASIAAGIRVAGAVGHDLAVLPAEGELLRIEHPSGSYEETGVSIRTARKLFDGRVYPRDREVGAQHG